MESQKKTATPIYLLWKRRDNFIRKRKSRGKYSESEFAAAKMYINDCYEKSQLDFEYAKDQYEKDMDIKVILILLVFMKIIKKIKFRLIPCG